MGNSLQDQLLNAGLVDREQVDKANREKKKQGRAQRNRKGGKKAAASAPRPQPQATAKSERDRELNARRQEARQQREIAAQVKQLVDANRHPRSNPDNDVAFHFENKGKVKRIYVAPETRKMITDGRLVIVNANGAFELVPPEIAERIRQRNPSLVVDLPKEAPESTEDDPYAAYQVPDDLMW